MQLSRKKNFLSLICCPCKSALLQDLNSKILFKRIDAIDESTITAHNTSPSSSQRKKQIDIRDVQVLSQAVKVSFERVSNFGEEKIHNWSLVNVWSNPVVIANGNLSKKILYNGFKSR